MTITVIGTGFVGVVTAAVFADFGNTVYGLDIDEKKIQSLREGKIPFFEPDLKELTLKGLESGRLTFTTDYTKAIPESDVIMIAVGTPSAPDGQADLTYVLKAAESLAPHLKEGAIVALKSTVPPGTNEKVESAIREKTNTRFYTASLPEFLKEGSAVHDTLNPDRIIIGAVEPEVIDRLTELHKPLKAPVIVMKPASAQMSKYSANAYLAMRITFINQIANLCEHNGADIQEVIKGIGADKRIGSHYWYPGLGYGGSCFPKDVKELAAYSKAVGQGNGLLVKIDELNEERIPILLENFTKQVGDWKEKKVAVLGLSFKPNTDDMREAPSLKLIPRLLNLGASVTGYDPKANDLAKKLMPELKIASDPYTAAEDADVVFVLVEWPELITLDLPLINKKMAGNTFIDVRNQYEPSKVTQAGLVYIGIGR